MLQGLVPGYMEYCWAESSQLEFILIVPQTILSQKCTVISKKQPQYFPTTLCFIGIWGRGERDYSVGFTLHVNSELGPCLKKCILWKGKKKELWLHVNFSSSSCLLIICSVCKGNASCIFVHIPYRGNKDESINWWMLHSVMSLHLSPLLHYQLGRDSRSISPASQADH